MKKEIYEKMRGKLNGFPMGAPDAKELEEILHILMTEEEAEVAIGLTPFPEEPGAIARRMKVDEEKLVSILERLSDKGLVFCLKRDGKTKYSLFPLIPGIFELQFMKAETTPEKKRLAELFNAYYFKGWGAASFGHKQPFARVITVKKEIPTSVEVQPYDVVSELIENSGTLALTNCFCRHEKELIGESCGAPKEVCMVFGTFADFVVDRGFGRRVTKEEMRCALDVAEEAGLVHVSDNVQEKASFICNCCGCCCGILGMITKLNIPTSVAHSRFVVKIDESACTGCGECGDRCHVKAIKVDEDDEVARLAGENKCIGCGLCVSSCPSGALEMVERSDWTEPRKNPRELFMEIAKERKLI
jgi:Na+-translocating ferredoxin:NAD+ oxidoreductase subunit B